MKLSKNICYRNGGGACLVDSVIGGNVEISDNFGHNGGGIFLQDSTMCGGSGNYRPLIKKNKADVAGGGVFSTASSYAPITNCDIFKNIVKSHDYKGGLFGQHKTDSYFGGGLYYTNMQKFMEGDGYAKAVTSCRIKGNGVLNKGGVPVFENIYVANRHDTDLAWIGQKTLTGAGEFEGGVREDLPILQYIKKHNTTGKDWKKDWKWVVSGVVSVASAVVIVATWGAGTPAAVAAETAADATVLSAETVAALEGAGICAATLPPAIAADTAAVASIAATASTEGTLAAQIELCTMLMGMKTCGIIVP